MTHLVIVGDSLLDRDLDGRAERLAPDAPVPVVDQPVDRARPGGAALAAVLAARDGRDVTFVTALGDDDAGRTVAQFLASAGVKVLDVGADSATGQKVRVCAAGRPVVRVDHGGTTDRVGTPDAAVIDVVRSGRTVLVSDYGRGITSQPQLRTAVAAAAAGGRVVWDPHPRGADPVPRARLITPNLDELTRTAGCAAAGLPAITDAAAALRSRCNAAAVAVTLGARGAILVGADGTPLVVPTRQLSGMHDPCGAGDRFATSAAGAIADGAVLSEAVISGVRSATAFVAAGGAGRIDVAAGPAPHDDGTERGATTRAEDVTAAVRARGGTVVATGGCFDLLHAGHVRLLADARRLGDCLVVCLNSDASVRRRKGAGRPVVSEQDRRAVLLALAAVDAVAVFDEDTPGQVLTRLRPDVWVKGADYALGDLPEAELLTSWGGRAVVLPYLDGRSTSALIQEAVRHAGH